MELHQQEAAVPRGQGGHPRASRFVLAAVAVALALAAIWALGTEGALSWLPLILGVLIALGAGRLMGWGHALARKRHEALATRLDASVEALQDLQWELREREARYRDLLDHQGDVILRRDPELRLTFANDAF